MHDGPTIARTGSPLPNLASCYALNCHRPPPITSKVISSHCVLPASAFCQPRPRNPSILPPTPTVLCDLVVDLQKPPLILEIVPTRTQISPFLPPHERRRENPLQYLRYPYRLATRIQTGKHTATFELQGGQGRSQSNYWDHGAVPLQFQLVAREATALD
jgi:hypothetical protein